LKRMKGFICGSSRESGRSDKKTLSLMIAIKGA